MNDPETRLMLRFRISQLQNKISFPPQLTSFGKTFQLGGYASHYACPISWAGLGKKPHGRVPGTVAPVPEPAPTAVEAIEHPYGFGKAAGQVGNRCIHRDDQVKL